MQSIARMLVLLSGPIVLFGCGGSTADLETTPTAEAGSPVAEPDGDQPSAEQDVATATPGDSERGPVYTVAKYDPKANPTDELAATVTVAAASGKRILLQVGGDWCGWCHLLDEYVKTNEPVGKALRSHFVIMKVNYSDENRNEAFLKQYPEIPGYPHLFVLESDGTFLHSQGTAELEEGRGYNEQVFLEFLEKWQPAEVGAERQAES